MTPHQLRLTAAALENGKIIAYPTEAVWGLGCNPLDAEAVYKLLNIKQRPVSKGLILIASDYSQLRPYLADLSTAELAPAMQSWPGPFTWLIPAADNTPAWLTGQHDTIAVRITAHPVARAICEHSGMAIVSTSCNLAGQKPARSSLQARLRCPDASFYLHGDVNLQANPSVIQDLLSSRIVRA